jgi:hypothetical protein
LFFAAFDIVYFEGFGHYLLFFKVEKEATSETVNILLKFGELQHAFRSLVGCYLPPFAKRVTCNSVEKSIHLEVVGPQGLLVSKNKPNLIRGALKGNLTESNEKLVHR